MSHSIITHRCDEGQLSDILRTIRRCCDYGHDQSALLVITKALEDIQRTVHANEAMLLRLSKELFEPTVVFTPGKPQDKEL